MDVDRSILRPPSPEAMLRRVAVCFFLSGATGLVYEVVWIRMLGLIFGHTVFAITTVLTAFMAGLGLGSWIFGRLVDRSRNTLLLYGLLEGGIGVFCLAVPLLIALAERVYLALHRLLDLPYHAFSLMQFALVFALLLVPTTLMGATLPVLSRFFVRSDATLTRRVALLYSLNTFGAVAGVAAAGYFMLPVFGMRGTLYLAAIINLGIAALIVLWSRSVPAMEGEAGMAVAPDPAPPRVHPDRLPDRLAGLAVLGLGLSGVASMVYEVAWSRALALVIGSSTYAFTAMLLAFLIGIALGSAIFSRVAGTRRPDLLVFGLLQTAIGLTAVFMLPLFGALPDVFLGLFGVSTAPRFVQAMQIVLSLGVMLLPTLVIGATFPCAVGIASRGGKRVGSDVGRVYAVNTLGGVAGSFIAGFVLIPWIGAQAAVRLAVILNVLIGALFIAAAIKRVPARRWAPWAVISVVALGGVLLLPDWSREAMSSGVAVYGPMYASGRGSVREAMTTLRLLSYEEGISATVSVHEDAAGGRSLRVNGKTDASTGPDMQTQIMSGHLPLLLHERNPKSVLVIGLGSGVTVAAVARYPVERIIVVEIEPAVVRGAKYFESVNRNVLGDPRVKMVIGDGRNFLLNTAERFDVVISEPSNPWIGGLATLFSREFFALAHQRLNPGGLMLQWVQGYGLAPDDLRMVVRTFQTAFSKTSIWNTTTSDFLLLGRDNLVPLDLGRLRRQYEIPGVADDFQSIGFPAAMAMLSTFMLSEADADRYTAGAALNTDDRLQLEFSAPQSLHADTVERNRAIMNQHRRDLFPAVSHDGGAGLETADARWDIGRGYLARGLLREGVAQFEKVLELDPSRLSARVALGTTQLRVGLPLKATSNLQAVLARDPNHAGAMYGLGTTYALQQMPEQALGLLSRAVELAPRNVDYRIRLAEELRQQGKFAEAVAEYREARALKPADPAIVAALGVALVSQRQTEAAIGVFKEAMALDGRNPGRFAHDLGRAYLQAARYPEAAAVLRDAATNTPLSIDVLTDLAIALAGSGRLAESAETFARALRLDPYHPAIQRLTDSRSQGSSSVQR